MKYFILLILFQLQLTAQEEYIIIGNGGGFSGERTEYKILKNGSVLKGTGIADIKFENGSSISKKETKKIFKKIVVSASESFNHPGNMYYFIYLIKPNSEIKCIWGSPNFTIPVELNEIYRETIQKLSALEYNPINN